MGRTRDYNSTIDSKSYSLGRDLQKDSGSVAEVLSHVPGVQVTPDGEIEQWPSRSVGDSTGM